LYKPGKNRPGKAGQITHTQGEGNGTYMQGECNGNYQERSCAPRNNHAEDQILGKAEAADDQQSKNKEERREEPCSLIPQPCCLHARKEAQCGSRNALITQGLRAATVLGQARRPLSESTQFPTCCFDKEILRTVLLGLAPLFCSGTSVVLPLSCSALVLRLLRISRRPATPITVATPTNNLPLMARVNADGKKDESLSSPEHLLSPMPPSDQSGKIPSPRGGTGLDLHVEVSRICSDL
jgi:hypothetical protein